jgi:hypothetical protein
VNDSSDAPRRVRPPDEASAAEARPRHRPDPCRQRPDGHRGRLRQRLRRCVRGWRRNANGPFYAECGRAIVEALREVVKVEVRHTVPDRAGPQLTRAVWGLRARNPSSWSCPRPPSRRSPPPPAMLPRTHLQLLLLQMLLLLRRSLSRRPPRRSRPPASERSLPVRLPGTGGVFCQPRKLPWFILCS